MTVKSPYGASAKEIWEYIKRTLTNPDVLTEYDKMRVGLLNGREVKLDNLDVAVSTRSSHTPADVWSYSDKRLTIIVPSNTLRVSNDAEKTVTSILFTKKKEIVSGISGVWRTYFELRYSSGTEVRAVIYRNGSAYGTQRSTTSTTYVSFTEDLAFIAGDAVQLYCMLDSDGTSYVRNFRLLGDPQNVYGYNTLI